MHPQRDAPARLPCWIELGSRPCRRAPTAACALLAALLVALGCATAGTGPRRLAAAVCCLCARVRRVVPHHERLDRGPIAQASVALGQGSVLWLYADSWVGDIRQGKHVNATMTPQLGCHPAGRDPATASVEFFYGRTADGKPAALLTPSDRARVLLAHERGADNPRPYPACDASEKGRRSRGEAFGFEQLASWMVAVANPESTPTRWQL